MGVLTLDATRIAIDDDRLQELIRHILGVVVVDGLDSLRLDDIDEEDDYTATVYGSRFAAEDLPRHSMPDKEMPPQVYVAALSVFRLASHSRLIHVIAERIV